MPREYSRWEPQTVEIEWMDDRKESFDCGGFCDALEIANGSLHLYYKGGAIEPINTVASIPLHNVRKWKPRSVRNG